jgi:hypothetical protein
MQLGLQFGILDLLILTMTVGVLLMLCQPVKRQRATGLPWLIGGWRNGPAVLTIYPDGCYDYDRGGNLDNFTGGPSWILRRAGRADGEFLLECGALRLLIRTESGSDIMDVLSEDGSVQSQFQRYTQMDGPVRRGVPHGTWELVESGRVCDVLEYRDGELIDYRQSNGLRFLATLNGLRARKGWPALAEDDFPKGPNDMRGLSPFRKSLPL